MLQWLRECAFFNSFVLGRRGARTNKFVHGTRGSRLENSTIFGFAAYALKTVRI